MKKVRVSNQVKLIGTRRARDGREVVDYYFILPDQTRMYAFTGRYYEHAYELCRGGERVNRLISTRTTDHGVMNLVDRLNLILPYFVKYWDLPAESGTAGSRPYYAA